MQEAGVPGYETYSMFALFAHARTPAEINEKIRDDVTEIIMQPRSKPWSAPAASRCGAPPRLNFSGLSIRDTLKWQNVIETVKLKSKIKEE